MHKDSRIGFALSGETRKRVERIAKGLGVSISTVVRWAIEEYLKERRNEAPANRPRQG